MRYLPLTDADRQAMLATIGVSSIDALYRDVPEGAYSAMPLPGLPNHQGELEVERILSALAAKNLPVSAAPSFLGAGAYRHHIPASVDYLIQRGEFLTAYTPYQPEISQGTLQVMFEFQTQVALLTGMEVANASMYDGATACLEAVHMANRITRRTRVLLSGGVHPHYRDVVRTMARFAGFEAETFAPDVLGEENLTERVDRTVSCVVVQTPSLFGQLNDFTALAEACHAVGALLVVVVTEVVSLGLLTPPGAMGADIVVGEGQSLGLPLSFGGPYLGLFATREKYVRQMPGRLCGETVDADGKRGFVLTLATREQHIRREKATSNICTNAGLCALAFSIHLSLLGETGLKRLAVLNHGLAVDAARRLGRLSGVRVLNQGFFNEFTISLPKRASKVVNKLARREILAGVPVSRLYPEEEELDRLLLVAVTETCTQRDILALCEALEDVL